MATKTRVFLFSHYTFKKLLKLPSFIFFVRPTLLEWFDNFVSSSTKLRRRSTVKFEFEFRPSDIAMLPRIWKCKFYTQHWWRQREEENQSSCKSETNDSGDLLVSSGSVFSSWTSTHKRGSKNEALLNEWRTWQTFTWEFWVFSLFRLALVGWKILLASSENISQLKIQNISYIFPNDELIFNLLGYANKFFMRQNENTRA